MKICWECHRDYTKAELDWNSLQEHQIIHRSRMQELNHRKHQLYADTFQYVCTAAPCHQVFLSERRRRYHERGKECTRIMFIKQYTGKKGMSIANRDAIPNRSTKDLCEFLSPRPSISRVKFGLDKSSLISHYNLFSKTDLFDEVSRRLSLKGDCDMSIFRLHVSDALKKARVLQLAIHDNITEHLSLLEEIKDSTLADSTKRDIFTRMEDIQSDRDEMLESLQELEQHGVIKQKNNTELRKLKTKNRRKNFDSAYFSAYKTISSVYNQQGIEVEPLLSSIDSSLLTNPNKL